MGKYAFENVCIFHILDGLREGLSHFSQPSRAALIYATSPDAPPHIYDPQDLLRGHEPRLQEFYLYSNRWRGKPEESMEIQFLSDKHYKDLDMSGIIAFGGRSKAIHYQMWFTEEHPDMCSIGPTRHWLEYAARLFAQNYQLQDTMNIDTAGYVLQHCATHAVRDFIVDERSRRGWLDTKIRVYPFLDAVLGVSSTKEEGAWARGRVVVVEPDQLDQVRFITKFPALERPQLANFKHVRKLLQAVEFSGRVLISDGKSVLGIAIGNMPGAYLTAYFCGSYGFLLLGEELLCSFTEGAFHSSNLKANLVQLEEVLLETNLDMSDQHGLMQVVSLMVNRARERKHGCTLVVDLGEPGKLEMSGQHFETPLDLTDSVHLKLACSLAKLDGALHLGRDIRLHGFACLMDGRSVPGENRARGARFNSALRFTAEHDDMIVIVVSADRPVSIIQNGVELTAMCNYGMPSGCPTPPLLAEWVTG